MKDRPEPKNDNNNLSPPPSPPPQPSFSQRPPLGPPPAPPFVPPPSGRFLEPFQRSQPPPRPNNFIGIPPAPSAPPLSPSDYHLLGPSSNTPSNNWYGTQTLTREREEIKDGVQKEFDNKIYELPNEPPRLELGDGLANLLGPQAGDILDEKFIKKNLKMWPLKKNTVLKK